MRAARELRSQREAGEVLRFWGVGIRVRRGPDWSWGDQDGGGTGIIVEGAEEDGWVRVKWDAGGEDNYRIGAGGDYDLTIAESHRDIRVGDEVRFTQPNEVVDFADCPGSTLLFNAGWTVTVREIDGGWFTSTRWPAQWAPVRVVQLVHSTEAAEAAPDVIAGSSALPAGEVLRSAQLGVRVRRGPDWDWDDQDGGGPGTTVEGCDHDGWVSVRWDAGGEYNYRVGERGLHDLVVDSSTAQSAAPSVQPGEVLRLAVAGVRVRRGPDWDWGGQDGGEGGLGTTTDNPALIGVQVRWDHDGSTNSYRVGRDGNYDLIVADVDGVPGADSRAAAGASSQSTAPAEPEGGHDEQWLDMEEATSMQCPICFCVPRDALAHECGNLFCEICWTRWIAQNSKCPVCREDGSSIVKAFRDQRKILNLMIRCPLGCEETFRLGDKEAHVSQCPKRKERCSLCGEEVLAEMISVHKKEECKARPMPCELCGEKVKMDELEAHMAANVGSHILALLKENKSLKKENESLKMDNGALKLRVDELEKRMIGSSKGDQQSEE